MQNFFSKKNCLSTKINLRLKKIQNSFCCRYQKNAIHSFSIYGNCMIFFFDKNFSYVVGYTEFYAKTRKCFLKIRRHHFSKMHEICMTSKFYGIV